MSRDERPKFFLKAFGVEKLKDLTLIPISLVAKLD